MLLVNLDRFKEVNATLGHAIGDNLLTEVGRRLRHGLGSDHVAGRLGGDEFAIVMPTATTPAAALAAAKRVRELLDEPVEVAGTSLCVDATIGAAPAIVPGHGTGPDSLLRHADVALHTTKANRGSTVVDDPDADPHSIDRLQLLSDLKGALTRGELVVHYQPQADAATGEIVGAEALLRWRHPTRGLVSPMTFIPLLERTSLMGPVTLEVLRHAERRRAGPGCSGPPRCLMWSVCGSDLTRSRSPGMSLGREERL